MAFFIIVGGLAEEIKHCELLSLNEVYLFYFFSSLFLSLTLSFYDLSRRLNFCCYLLISKYKLLTSYFVHRVEVSEFFKTLKKISSLHRRVIDFSKFLNRKKKGERASIEKLPSHVENKRKITIHAFDT